MTSPRLCRLSTTPVKGLALAHPGAVRVGAAGVEEDRRFLLVDVGAHKHAAPQCGALATVRAAYRPEADVLALTLPDGSVVEDQVTLGEPIESVFPGGTRTGRVVVGPWAGPLSEVAGTPLRLVKTERVGAAQDVHPVTLVSTASVRDLGRRLGRPDLDGRRFRMTLELDGLDPYEEERWIGREVAVGGGVLRILDRVPRCVATTRDPVTGERDVDTLAALAAYRRTLDGVALPLGVYAEVVRPGTLAVGDEVVPLGRAQLHRPPGPGRGARRGDAAAGVAPAGAAGPRAVVAGRP